LEMQKAAAEATRTILVLLLDGLNDKRAKPSEILSGHNQC
jgi:hypothetical protein